MTGNFSVNYYVKPNIYHIIYADADTCFADKESEEGSNQEEETFIQYRLQFLNPDSLGNPTEHFGDDETGELLQACLD